MHACIGRKKIRRQIEMLMLHSSYHEKKKLKRLQNQSYFTLIIDVILPGFSCSDRKDQMRWMLSFPREAQKIPSSSLRRSSQT